MIKHTLILSLRKVLILSASFLLVLSSCKKEGELNPEFAEDTSSTQFTDQIALSTNTVKVDSVIADKIASGLAGLYQDSVFGKSKANFTIQPLLSSNFLVFYEANEQFVTDSVVLSLQYDGIFGDTTQQTFEVYRVEEQLDFEEVYPSNKQVQVNPNPIANHTFRPNLRQDVEIYSPNALGLYDTLTFDPQLRIKLDNAIGNEILSKSGQTEVSNDENFTSFFKGLHVSAVDPGNLNQNENAILYFALTSSATKMTIYYSVIDQQGDTTKRAVDFPIKNTSSVRFNTFEHDFSGSVVESVIQNQDHDTLYSYTEAMAGVRTNISFPDISDYRNKSITVNKAELVLPAAAGSYTQFGYASQLILAAEDASGTLQFIPDYYEGESYFGGEFDPTNQTYTFNISRYIQGLINNTETKEELTLLVTGSAVRAERAVIFAPNNPNRRIKLNLYYSNTD